jgi:hypothetical protein
MVRTGQAPAPSTAFAGPFLRYQNVVPGTNRWLGSLLFLTRSAQGAAVNGGLAAQGDLAAAGASSPQPKLLLEGGFTAGTASTATSQQDGNTGLPSMAGSQSQPPTLLDACQGWQFWRFELDLELGPHQRPVHYSVEWGGGSDGGGGATEPFTFWLPAAGQAFHAAYYSCNGFTEGGRANPALNVLPRHDDYMELGMSTLICLCWLANWGADVKPDAAERADPDYLWRDLLQVHSAFPMHALIGGGEP